MHPPGIIPTPILPISSIQQITIWQNGINIQGSAIVIGTTYFGTIGSPPTFSYWIQDDNGNDITNGQVTLTSDQYSNWVPGSGDNNANPTDLAYFTYCAIANLNLSS